MVCPSLAEALWFHSGPNVPGPREAQRSSNGFSAAFFDMLGLPALGDRLPTGYLHAFDMCQYGLLFPINGPPQR